MSEDPAPGTDGARWMHTPELGVFYAQTDSVGNMVVPEDRIRYAMEVAGNDARELHRELRLALGQAWGTPAFHRARVADHMLSAPLGADRTFGIQHSEETRREAA